MILLALTGAGIGVAEAAIPRDISAHLERGRAALLSTPEQALQEGETARRLSLNVSFRRDQALALAASDWLRIAALINLNRLADATAITNSALRGPIAKLAPDSVEYANLLVMRAISARSSGNLEVALADSLKAYEIFSATGQDRSRAIALSSIGSIYLVARDYPNALRYYAQAADAYRADAALLVAAYGNRGVALKELGRYPAAEAEFERGLAVARQQGSPMLQARILGDLAATQIRAGRLPQAKRSVDQGLSLLNTSGDKAFVPFLLGAKAQLAERSGRHDEAARLVERVFGSADLSKTPAEMREFLETGYTANKAKGTDARALEYLEAYKVVDDRARSLAASANAALMSARFDFANQQSRIAQLRANEVRQQATIEQGRARTRSIILGGLLVVTGIVSSLLLFGFVSIRRSRDRERAANEELSTTNVELEKALAARTEFLATTSHEIRTPLNGILGMTQVLLADRAIDPPVREKIQLVHGAGQTMKALVDDILDVAKMTSGEIRIEKAPMNLAALLRDAVRVWEGQAATKGIKVALSAEDAPEEIVEDEVRLRQIVFNLMSNAVKFTDRGEARLAASVVRDGGPESEGRLRISVSDTGIGIPADRLDDVFESFRQIDGGTTRRHGGTGLGLAICRNLARAMGGDVTVTSILGAGATFTLDLPLQIVTKPTRAVMAEGQAKRLPSARLLLVEANPLSQSVMRAVLTPHVASLAAVSNVDEAIAIIDSGEADLILVDAATLGSDMSQAGRLALSGNAAGARLALLWPSPDREIEEAAAAQGVELLIAKPINATDLVARLTSLMVGTPSPAGIAA
ncbi:ATP-binding protein [Sphingomonas sp.]|uniref:ATP-binding protein n=1 Tax=Sphingomonas sp. TaxID=28214 RepID=UPI0025E7731A|nr:ATP-binding protein [Sphingomonas sp.]